jgi:hypothetical protein
MDPSPFETIPSNEAACIADLAQRLQSKIQNEYPTGSMHRDTHPKMYGLVKAEFTVLDDIPPELAIGLFSQPKTYQAWIRFSNQDSSSKPDGSPDIRGMAIKLMGVAGEKLIDAQCGSHDFILINPPMFIAKDVQEFNDFLKVLMGSLWQKIFFFLSHWRLTWNLLRSLKRIANPLQINYHSTTPYLLGAGQAVKYAAHPRNFIADTIPSPAPANFLRDAMKTQISQDDAYFDFCIQRRTDENTMSIENSTIAWSEEDAPFQKVAQIRIFQQEFDTKAQDQFGENLSFTPWHCLAEHRPLGGINRARKVVYEKISQFRHACNQVVRKEPTSWEI